MLFKCFLVMFLLLYYYGQISAQEISKFSPAQVKTVGDSVNLECVLHNANASEYFFSWLKETAEPYNPHKILSRGSRTIPNDRYSVSYFPLQGTTDAAIFKLQIKDLRIFDSGTYLCNVHLSATTRLEGAITLRVEPAAESSTTRQQVGTNSTESVLVTTEAPAPNNVTELNR